MCSQHSCQQKPCKYWPWCEVLCLSSHDFLFLILGFSFLSFWFWWWTAVTIGILCLLLTWALRFWVHVSTERHKWGYHIFLPGRKRHLWQHATKLQVLSEAKQPSHYFIPYIFLDLFSGEEKRRYNWRSEMGNWCCKKTTALVSIPGDTHHNHLAGRI